MDDEDEDVVKAMIVGRDVRAPSSTTERDSISTSMGAHVLAPPYDPVMLSKIFESSSCLRPNVDAYETNIDGFGHQLEPELKDGAAGEKQVLESLWVQRFAQTAEDETGTAGFIQQVPAQPTQLEVLAALEQLKPLIEVERIRLETFLTACSPEGSFTALRRERRRDLEITGNAYWEVLRTKTGAIARFVRVPPDYVRHTRLDTTPVTVDDRTAVGLFAWEVVRQPVRFRRYAQRVGTKTIWFKQFGDPRVVSRSTGTVYKNLAEFYAKRARGDKPANEVIHFFISPTSNGYGIPRWVGNLLSVLGSRAADEVNHAYFDNKAVPPLAVLVAGAKMDDPTVEKLERHIETNVKGRKRFHSILVLQAVAKQGEMTSRAPTIDIKPLQSAANSDAQFQKYDERNIDKVGMSFRQPRILRGDMRDFNKGTAKSALDFTEEQVYQPERSAFDDWFNRVIAPRIGVRYWRLRSLGVQSRDPDATTANVERMTRAGAITPNEARTVLAPAVGVDLPPTKEEWGDTPALFTAQISGMPQPGVDHAGRRSRGQDPEQPPQDQPVEPRAPAELAKSAPALASELGVAVLEVMKAVLANDIPPEEGEALLRALGVAEDLVQRFTRGAPRG